MEEINIGDKIMFHITGNHNMGYTKGKKYVGTVLSRDSRSRLHVRAEGMPMQHDKRVFTVQIIYQLVKLPSRHLIVILFPCYKCDLSLPLSSRIAHRSTHLLLAYQHNMIHLI